MTIKALQFTSAAYFLLACSYGLNFAFSALMLLVGWQEGHLAVKN